jgi:Transglycosylase SLT domain
MGRLLRRGAARGKPDGASCPGPDGAPPRSRRRGRGRVRSLALGGAGAFGVVAGLVVGLVVQAQGPALAIARQAATGTPDNGSSLRQITLPDLLIVVPKGLTPAQVSKLGAIAGLRDMAIFDGAEIKAGGAAVTVLGVDPSTLRSWVPLRAASDQAFWTALAAGEFVAQTPASTALQLKPGAQYQLAGGSTVVVRYGLAATLGLTGVDLLVNQSLSARLGLVRRVVGLISAPGVAIGTLQSEVTQILGASGQIEVLRSQPVPAAPSSAAPLAGTGSTSARPTSYLELFQASAADYCPGLSWTVLAAIAQIESGDGQNDGPSSAGALGPMQFLPSTWAVWGIDAFGETGPPDVMDPYDAVPSAARMLCADGAAAGGTALSDAIFDYNHADWYVSEVLALAAQYAADYG